MYFHTFSKDHAFTWFKLSSRSTFLPCSLHGDYAKWKRLGNNGTFFFGDGGSRNDLHGVCFYSKKWPRYYYHEIYSFYHSFLPCYFLIFMQSMFTFLVFFAHAERSNLIFSRFWVFFFTWELLCFCVGVFFLHWMFFT